MPASHVPTCRWTSSSALRPSSPTRRITPSFRARSIFVPDVLDDSRRGFAGASDRRRRSSFIEISLPRLSSRSSASALLDSRPLLASLERSVGRWSAERRDVDKIIQYRQGRRGDRYRRRLVGDSLNVARNRRKNVGQKDVPTGRGGGRRRDRLSSSLAAT